MRAEMSRPIDSLGRICLPKEVRDSLGIRENDRLTVTVSGERIILKKSKEACILCNGTRDLVPFEEGKSICAGCVQAVRKILL